MNPNARRESNSSDEYSSSIEFSYVTKPFFDPKANIEILFFVIQTVLHLNL